MEQNFSDLLAQIEKVFVSHNFVKKENDFENRNVKFVYANHDPIVGHGYFLRVNDELVETVYFSSVQMINETLKKFSGYGGR